MMLRGGACIQSGRAAVCVCMRPPRRGECSGAPHWLVGCDSLTGQGQFEYHVLVPCEMSKLLACLRGWLITRERSAAARVAASYLHLRYVNLYLNESRPKCMKCLN